MDNLDFDKTVDDNMEKKKPSVLSSGSHLGQYRIIRLLGRGGMGEVYEVEHDVLRKRYALKLLPQEIMKQKDFLPRFKREAHVMANLEHPNIVKVDDFGEIQGRYWLRMELVEGLTTDGKKATSLDELASLNAGKIEQTLLADILAQILEALSYAHGRKVIHRDLKPANVLLSGKNKAGGIEVKISDFGLVRIIGEQWVLSQAELSVSRTMSVGEKLTEGGEEKEGSSTRSLLGTYEYMSPEQKKGKEADERSDLYAVGLMTHRLLTGQRELSYDLPSQIDNSLVPGWDEMVRKALRPEPEQRFGNAQEMMSGVANIRTSLLEQKTLAEKGKKTKREEQRRKDEERKKQEERRRREEKRKKAKAVKAEKPGRQSRDRRLRKVIAGVAIIVIGIIVYSLLQSVLGSRRAVCRSNIREIGQCAKMFAIDHDERFPDRLEQLIPDYINHIPVCPSAPKGQKCSYILTPGLTENVRYPSKTILIQCKLENHNHKGTNVYFVDGHTEWVTTDELKKLRGHSP